MALSVLVLTVTILHLARFIESAPLSSYLVSSFTSPDTYLPFNHLAINNVTGDVYIGARERLYQLSSDLTLKQTVTLGQCPKEDDTINVNDNKLLVVAPSPNNRLITCGGCDGYCETRSLENISADVTRHAESMANQRAVATGDAVTVGAVVLGATVTIVSGTDTRYGIENDALYLFTGKGGATISKHYLTDLISEQRITSENNMNVFVQVIHYTDFLYYFIQRNNKAHIGRLCPNSLDANLESYSEIELQCGSHPVIQAAHIGPAGSQLADSLGINSTDGVLYAVFGDGASPAESALCLYKMSDIQQSYQTAVLGCIRSGDDSGVAINYLNGQCDSIGKGSGYNPPDDVYLCTAALDATVTDGNYYYKYAAGMTPVQGTPLLSLSATMVTSIITTQDREHTVAVIGTHDGDLIKVHIVNATIASDYETVPLGDGSVLRDMFLDEKEELTLAMSGDSGSQVLKLSLANCGQYRTCDACIGGNGGNDGDPYCGWCTLEARCKRYEECPLASESTRWLPYNALQCVGISNVQPNGIPYQEIEEQITITVQQLPSLSGSSQYRCAFDSYTVSATTNNDDVTCMTPPTNSLPNISSGASSVTATLSIIATETDVSFVSTQFTFFDCSLIESCTSCVTSPWPCDWCIYDNSCTHDNTTCQAGDTIVIGGNNPFGSGKKGKEYCPQLLGTAEEFLLPVNVSSSYTVLAKNLPTDQTRVQSYECIVHVEESDVAVQSTNYNDTYIVCPESLYSYKEDILRNNASVSVRWNGNVIDDLMETHVTLYKCSVNSGSCSRCLSPEATPPMLQCGWCETDCNVAQSDVCQTITFLWQNQTQLCDGPEITDFYPKSGPIEGHTVLEVTGTNIGVAFSDVVRISVGDLTCNLTGMEAFYQAGQSVRCVTRSGTMSSAAVSITVDSGPENRTGASHEHFHYRDPVITGFSPTVGPAAGGTRVTIQGEFLDTGRDITAAFGSYSCEDLAVAENEARCTTTGTPQNEMSAHQFTMTFDTALRTSQGVFEYMPNPQVESISRTETIRSGGLDIVVTGTGFNLIQNAWIIATSLSTSLNSSEPCNNNNTSSTSLVCPTPPYPGDPSVRRRRTTEDLVANLTLDLDGFIVDLGIMSYQPDPSYFDFPGPNRIFDVPSNRLLEFNGTNLDSAADDDSIDVRILVGRYGTCDVFKEIIEPTRLVCQLPDQIPETGDYNGSLGEGVAIELPAVVILHGNNLLFSPGYVRYSTSAPINIGVVVGSVMACAVVIIIVMVLVGIFLFKRSRKMLDEQAEELELVGKKIQDRVHTAFHDLQVDMSEVEEQLKGLGIPFVNTQDYTKNMLFSGLDILPATADPEYMDEALEVAMIAFSRQLNDQDFLVSFIQELEVKRRGQRRDRVNIASLITVILMSEGKFDYFTQVLNRLLEDAISEAADEGRMRALFRRTETIVQKLLSNWLSLCVYQYLKKHVARSLYLLYQAMKIQVEKGPIDVITGQSYFSLNFDCLMEEEVEFNEMSLSVAGRDDGFTYYVKVLDTDCISQVKQKILDAAYRKQHFVRQSRAHEMDLLWYHPGGEQRVLRDQDEYNAPTGSDRTVCINTLKSLEVADGSRVALIDKVENLAERRGNYEPVSPGAKLFYLQDELDGNDVRMRDYIRMQGQEEDGFPLWHLIPEEHMQTDENACKTKLDKEFSAPHLLVTKKTIEPFLNEFLAAIFEQPDSTPVTIKHLFDFFDKMAAKYCSEKHNENAEAWKSNSLPQHYWVTTLTHPSYIFDMRQSRSADQSVSVLANMLDNACKKVIPEASQDSSLNRVLFLKDLPKYIKTISEYYRKLAHRQAPSHVDLQGEFNRLGQEFAGLFSRVGTLKLLYDFTREDVAELLGPVAEASRDQPSTSFKFQAII